MNGQGVADKGFGELSGWAWWARLGVYGAATWGFAFAFVHLYWLFGGRVGLPDDLSLFDNLPLLIIDIVAVPLCVLAALVALARVTRWGRRVPQQLLNIAIYGTAFVLLMHAFPSAVDWFALAIGALSVDDLDSMERFATFLYEPFFFAGGLLFAVAASARR
ncbi:MAG: DUF3995 domain-containing protein [Corynebacteriales bacterium]|nr:DUF3995 domain-containing protein [Mycobacteriales bacterium]